MHISLTDISYSYPQPGGGIRPALRGVNLTIPKGSRLGVIGPEGAGKTTLLLLLDLLLTPESGTLSIDGNRCDPRSSSAIPLRKRIGMEFQFPENQFVAQSVREELLFGIDATDGAVFPSAEDALRWVGLEPRSVMNRSPFLLSMGEARRVALASLLLRDPELLLLDEPTVGLDGPGREDFISAVSGLASAGKTMVIASHDLDALVEVATDVAILLGGHLVMAGDAVRILRDKELLERAGYDKPELFSILEVLASEGKIPGGSFYRSRELGPLLNRNPSAR